MKLIPNIGNQLACTVAYKEQYEDRARELLALDHLFPDPQEEDMFMADPDPFNAIENGRLSVVNGTAILKIEGFLSQHSSFVEKHLDLGTSYESILWSLNAIESDPDVHTMLVLINSGGGEVAGLSTVTKKMRQVAGSLQNHSYAFTDSLAASAAYALLISNSVVLADEWATVGSIGVVQIYSTDARRLDEAGVDVFVARSGEDKMKPSGVEPLDEKDKSILQKEVDQLSTLFFSLVENLRGHISGSDWKAGGTFIASEANKNNMIDAIIDFNSLQERLLQG